MSTSVSFPYQYKTIDNHRLADPVIYLTVQTRLGPRKIGFLVDTGSDTVVFPLVPYRYWFAFTQDKKHRTEVGGIEGKGITAYSGKVSLQIGKELVTVRCYFIDSKVLPLLGRLDLWDKFNWYFDNKKKRVIFERYDNEKRHCCAGNPAFI